MIKSIKQCLLLFTVLLVTTLTALAGAIKNATTETVKVYGNCDMCKANIEKAGKSKNVSKVIWNKDTKIATIIFDAKKTSLDAILKKIALAGYDSNNFLAPEAAYNNLPACCQYERAVKPVTNVPTAITLTDTMAMPKEKATNTINILQPVYDAYFLLKDALVKSDGTTASAKAKELETAINAVKMEQLDMNVHMVWMKVLADLKKDVVYISGTNDVAQQRTHFTMLSTNIYALVKVSKATETVYYDHCPMYNDGKGANWLSKETTIKNPYYGSMMLSCGKTVETIK